MDAKAKRTAKSSTNSKPKRRSKATGMTDEDALAEGHRLLALVNAFAALAIPMNGEGQPTSRRWR